jgi:general secretion pathway protein C
MEPLSLNEHAGASGTPSALAKKAILSPNEGRPLSEPGPVRSAEGAGSLDGEDVYVKRAPSLYSRDIGFKLVGTMVTDHPIGSLAIIDHGTNGRQLVLREGDRIGKLVIKRILQSYVIVGAGRREKILAVSGGQPSPGQLSPHPAATTQQPVIKASLDLEEVEPYLKDISQLKERLLLYPIKGGNEPAGFLIRNIRRGSILWRMGLRNRDVIKGVNGQRIKSREEADAFFRTLKDGGQIAVEIKRARRTQKLSIEIL